MVNFTSRPVTMNTPCLISPSCSSLAARWSTECADLWLSHQRLPSTSSSYYPECESRWIMPAVVVMLLSFFKKKKKKRKRNDRGICEEWEEETEEIDERHFERGRDAIWLCLRDWHMKRSMWCSKHLQACPVCQRDEVLCRWYTACV